MNVACIALDEGLSEIAGNQDPVLIRAEQNAVRVIGVNVDCVDDKGLRRHQLPCLPGVERAPESLGGPGKYDLGPSRMRIYEMGTTPRERNALDLRPLRAGVFREIDPRTRGREDPLRIVLHDRDREDVGIVEDSLLDREPRLAAVSRLSGKVRRTGENDVRVAWVNGDRVEVQEVGVAFGRNALPRISGVRGSKDRLQ